MRYWEIIADKLHNEVGGGAVASRLHAKRNCSLLLTLVRASGDRVGVEKFAGGKNFLKTLTERAFAGRNAARYSDSWHLRIEHSDTIIEQPQLNRWNYIARKVRLWRGQTELGCKANPFPDNLDRSSSRKEW
jgi:hypothetical protein